MLPYAVDAQDVGIKGTVRDAAEEPIYLANAIILPDSILAISDINGEFSAKVTRGLKTIMISYTGLETLTVTQNTDRDTIFNFVMIPLVAQLQEVLIEENRLSNDHAFESAISGTQTLSKNDLLRLPSFMGEADLLRAVRLLPGATPGMEGSADLFVRGGAADQNLVLLDGAPIYNPGHLLGFLSVFNPDILDQADIIHGGFPAEFGGNISQKCSCSPGLGGDAIHYINGATLDDYSCAFALARNSPWRYPSTASRKSL